LIVLSLSDGILSVPIPHWVLIILGLTVAFCLTGYIIPSIVNISRAKKLCYCPNSRTSHYIDTPTFGGIAVFIGFVLSMVLVSGNNSIFEQRYIFAALIIVFFIGIKDDILVIDPLKKLAGQIIAASILVLFADIRISNLYGLFHVGQLPYIASLLVTVFVFIVIINGFNLIDGIDGLASGAGMVSSLVFAIWFWKTGDIPYAIFCFSFIGSLAAFFVYNVFGKKNKIFLGDTGSMLIGFILSILTCHFLQEELASPGNIEFPAAPALVIGILIIPLFDSLRVFILRVSDGKSPFKADRQHLHHRLLQLGYSHLKATLVLLSINILFMISCFELQGIGIIKLTFLMAVIATILSNILVYYARKRSKQLTELELHLADYLKKMYRNKDGMIRKTDRIIVARPRHAPVSQN
jgi:UDP-GlcNAc:undecaprenyl-phosphate/decaprenyl-phosphate GlcNAc-1-phosphate transferase